MPDTALATDILTSVADVLTDVGKSITLRKVVVGDYTDPNNPSLGKIETVTNLTINAFVYDIDDGLVNDASVRIGDKLVLIDLNDSDLSGVTVDTNYQVVIDSRVWHIVDKGIQTVEVAGVKVVQILQVRS